MHFRARHGSAKEELAFNGHADGIAAHDDFFVGRHGDGKLRLVVGSHINVFGMLAAI